MIFHNILDHLQQQLEIDLVDLVVVEDAFQFQVMLLGVAYNSLLSDDEPITHDLLWSLIIHRAHLYDEQIEWAHELDDGLEVAYRELHLHRLHQDPVYGLPYHRISLHS